MESIMSLLGGSNISYFTLPAAFGLVMAPKYYIAYCARNLFDLANPRRLPGQVSESKDLDKITKERIFRAEACHSNALETISLYAAAVVAGNTSGIPAPTMNVLTVAYIASRALYTIAYVWLQDNRKFAPVRGTSWIVGIGIIMTLFIKSGLRM